APRERVAELRETLGLDAVQLHGDETPADVRALLPGAYKAIGVRGAEDVEGARAFPGERILLDARVPGGPPGGTGTAFEWALAERLAGERALLLAGGLRPGNVAEAVRRVRPFMVDVASGVESAPGVKDAAAMAAFVAAARAA
ncbi:MAG: phosphoribosylanthranilate isomerase, partial [Myxococcota bacterium]